MQSPKLSVIVPFYGVENYIEACLASIQAQHLKDVEVILVDDGSLDGSREIAEKFAETDHRFRIITQANAGLGPARNTGVAHASGEYLTFVDSDDLVTRHGFGLLVDGLDRTGSSLAGGNARRFNNSSGVRPSWAHLQPFKYTVLATHVYERPNLMRDRMVWNKVYRRSFWDQFGYEFPDIRYEDYPVTAKAQLDAVTVDVHHIPVYYWRERESGDSITQQVFRYDNLLDRVDSARRVIDIVAGAPSDVRYHTHLMLAETDFIAIVQSFDGVSDEQAQLNLDLGYHLIENLEPRVFEARSRYDQLQYEVLMRRDVEWLRELARFRAEGGLRGSVRARRVGRRHFEFPYPGYERRDRPREAYRPPASEIGLRTSVNELWWADDQLHIRGTAEVRQVRSQPGNSVSAHAVSKAVREGIPVLRHDDVDSHGEYGPVGVELAIPRSRLAAWADAGQPVRFDLHISSTGVRRNGLFNRLPGGSPVWARGGWVNDRIYCQPGRSITGEIQLTWIPDPWVLLEAAVDGDQMRLTARAPRALQIARLVLKGSDFAEPLEYPATCRIQDGRTIIEASIPLRDVLEHTDDDDPFLKTTARQVQLRATGGSYNLIWEAPRTSVGAVLGDHMFRLTRTTAGEVCLRETAPRPTASTASVQRDDNGDAVLLLSGHNWTGQDDWILTWRRYLPGGEEFVELPAGHTVGTTWMARTPLAGLLDVPARTSDLDTIAPVAHWTLFATSAAAGVSTGVLPEPFLVETLPVLHHTPGRRAVLREQADTVALDITDPA